MIQYVNGSDAHALTLYMDRFRLFEYPPLDLFSLYEYRKLAGVKGSCPFFVESPQDFIALTLGGYWVFISDAAGLV